MFFLFLHQSRGVEKNFSAVGGGRFAPRREGGFSGGDGFFHFLASGKRDARDDFVGVCRISPLDNLRRARFHPFAVDVISAKRRRASCRRHVVVLSVRGAIWALADGPTQFELSCGAGG